MQHGSIPRVPGAEKPGGEALRRALRAGCDGACEAVSRAVVVLVVRRTVCMCGRAFVWSAEKTTRCVSSRRERLLARLQRRDNPGAPGPRGRLPLFMQRLTSAFARRVTRPRRRQSRGKLSDCTVMAPAGVTARSGGCVLQVLASQITGGGGSGGGGNPEIDKPRARLRPTSSRRLHGVARQ